MTALTLTPGDMALLLCAGWAVIIGAVLYSLFDLFLGWMCDGAREES